MSSQRSQITDTPQILSGDRLLILDPHESTNSKELHGGVEIDFQSEREKYSSHFDAFAAVIAHHSLNAFDGTAIRLPLRLEPQAQISKIKNTATDVPDVRRMFKEFASKELAEALLFLRHISSIKLSEVGDDNRERTLAHAWIENAGALAPLRAQNRSRQKDPSHLEMTIHVEIEGEATARRWLVWHFVEDYIVVEKNLAHRLRRPTSDISTLFVAEKLLPHVALAVPLAPCGARSKSPSVATPVAGRLFTLLPLPIDTGFPLHLHGVLALTTSRQNLRNSHDVAIGSREECVPGCFMVTISLKAS
jgi:hypothetical protein